MTALRIVAAVVAGLLTSFILLVAVELFSAVVHPVPEDFQGTQEEMCRHVERYPNWILAVAGAMWGGTAFVGAWIAGRIGNTWSYAIVALLLLAGLVFNISMLPYAIWFKIMILLAVPAALVLAYRLSLRPKTAGVGETT